MTNSSAPWRATYAPGEWIVLSGPTSLVVLEPTSGEWSALINTLWEEVVASSSIVELAAKLAGYRIQEMPSFGAFFATPDGPRALIRGAVSVIDVSTGDTLASGQGIQTRTEVGLAGAEQFQIALQSNDLAAQALQLPLVVGAVRASSVILDASGSAPADLTPAATERRPDVDEESAAASPKPDLPDLPEVETESGGVETEPYAMSAGAGTVSPTPVEAETEPDFRDPEDPVPDPVDLMENADTELMRVPPAVLRGDDPWPTQPFEGIALPIHALLRATDGATVTLDRPVLIGRAPAADPAAVPAPRLLTVQSPSQDISRTHLRVAFVDGQITVTDLHSTNGTIVVAPSSGTQQRIAPGGTVEVELGSVLELGDGASVLIEPPP
jgi:hypothetical protein